MLSDKFLIWFKKRVPTGHGGQTRAANELGIGQPQVAKILGGSSGGNIGINTLEKISTAIGHQYVWELLKEIESGRPGRRKGELVSIEERYWPDWKSLFRANPRRAQVVLLNMRHQEKMGYTDLVSQVVRLIIDEGPNLAAGKVAAILGEYEEERDGQRTKLRRKLAEEYREIAEGK